LKRITRLTQVLALAALCTAPTALLAQESDEGEVEVHAEMTVTAEKREESLVEVPLSVTAVSGEKLNDAGVTDIREGYRYIPNLHMSHFATKRTNSAYIRGIGAGQGDPAVTVSVDGVPMLTPNSINIDFLDMERLEVLRGPQGTLYGRNTIGGSINYITREATNALSYDFTGETGDYGYFRAEAVARGPIVEDKVLFSIGGSLTERDGYTDNIVTGNDVDYKDGSFFRGQLIFLPTESWKIRVSAHTQDDDDGGFILYDVNQLRANPHQIAYDYEVGTTRELFGSSVNATYRGRSFDLHLIGAFNTMDSAEATDLDFNPFDLLRRDTIEEEEQSYAEIRLESVEDIRLGDRVTLDWLVGASYIALDQEHFEANEIRPAATGQPFSLVDSATYTRDDTGTGLFGTIGFTFDEVFDIDLGVRFANDDRGSDILIEAQTFGAVDSDRVDESYDEVLPRLALAYRIDDGLNIFGSYAKSYRPGGYNLNTTVGGPFTFDEETGNALEAGLKASLGEGRAYLSVTVFQIDWEDRQLSVPNVNIPGRFFLDNIADSETTGFEIEYVRRLSESFDLFASYGYNDSTFGSYIDSSGIDVDGNALPVMPDANWNLGLAHHSTAGDYGVLARIDAFGVGESYYDNLNTEGEDGYELVNARLGIERRGLRLELWVKNAFDEEYWPIGIPGTIAPGFVARGGDPRQVGLSISYRH